CKITYNENGNGWDIVKLLWNSSGDSEPDLSFDKSASLERLFGLAHASLVAVSKLYFSFGCSGGDYTSLCPPQSSICQASLSVLDLNIEPTVALFRVFQTLCKQGDWFSFAKRRAPSLACIDDKRSCMKHWKSGFFLVDRQAILDAMVWRHPDATIDDQGPDSLLRDMPEGVLVLSGLSRVWKNYFCDPVLRGADGNVMSIHDFLYLPEWTGVEVQEEPHLDVRPTLQRPYLFNCTPPMLSRTMLLYQTYSKDLSMVAKRTRSTRSALAQSSGSTTWPSLFAGDDDESDDDDACVEIPLVTPLRSAAVIPSSGNHGGSSVAPTAEGSNTRDSRGKGIMVDDAATPSDFFPFSAGPYYATYPEDGVAENCEFTQEEWDALYRPTFKVLTKEVFKDPAICKTIVDQFPTPREMVQVEVLSDD
ncbi:hypothetical protein Tco_1397298, partial [Tanacetum coccineum]